MSVVLAAASGLLASLLGLHGNSILWTFLGVGLVVLAGAETYQRKKHPRERPVDRLKKAKALKTVEDLDRVIGEAPRISAPLPTNTQEWVEPPAHVQMRADGWRATGDDAVAIWPEYHDDLASAENSDLPRYHAVNIGHRNDMLTAIRTTLRQRFGL
jgi:hypothetical protein